MERVERTIFLSYRRTNIPWALAIFQNLTNHGYDVFFDYQGVSAGDFEKAILGNLTSRAHFLVLLTPSALERCGDPEDWLRREIETALESRRNIIPLMLEGFDFGSPKIAEQLTGSLLPLKYYQALNVPADYFLEGMERLRSRYLNVALSSIIHPASPAAQRVATTQKAAAAAAPEVVEDELTAQQWFERGYEAADGDEKIRCYTQAIRLKPDYGDAFNNRGNAFRAKGNLDEALRDYDEAVKLQPDDAINVNNRGLAHYEKGDLDSALRDYDASIRLNVNYALAFYNRGIARGKKGDTEGSVKDYSEAIRLKPDDGDAFVNRGNALRAKGDLDGAIRDLNEAIRLQPNDPVDFYNRANAYFDRDDLDEALRDYNEAIRLKPDYAKAIYYRGSVRQKKGDTQGARADRKEAERLGYKP